MRARDEGGVIPTAAGATNTADVAVRGEPSFAVATVAGEPISLSRLEERVDELRRGRIGRHLPPDSHGEADRFRRWILQDLVNREVLINAARMAGLLAPDGVGVLTSGLLETLFARATAHVTVRDEDTLAYYRRNSDVYTRPESRRVRYVMAADRDDATRVAHEVFTELVSNDPGGSSNQPGRGAPARTRPSPSVGQLPELHRGELVGPLEDALFAASVGELVGPVKLDGRWWVARVDAIVPPSRVAFHDARASIEDALLATARERAFEEWLELQRRELVEIAPAFEHPGHPVHGLRQHHH